MTSPGASPVVSLRRRAVVSVVNFIIRVANRSVAIADLQREHNATLGRVFVMRVPDVSQEWFFRVWKGRLEVLSGVHKPTGGFDVESETLLALAKGVRRVRDPGSGDEFEVSFTPMDALVHGDLRIWGEAVSNDALLFLKAVYREVAPQIQREVAARPSEPADSP